MSRPPRRGPAVHGADRAPSEAPRSGKAVSSRLVEPNENIDNLLSEILRESGVVRDTVHQGVRSVGGIRISFHISPVAASEVMKNMGEYILWRLSPVLA